MIESTLYTARLKFQLISHSDMEFIHDLLSCEETDRYNALGTPKSLEETVSIVTPWIDRNQQTPLVNYTWIVENLENGEDIGLFGLKLSNDKYKRAEVWYKNHPNHWGKGYATEALNRILKFGFEDCQLHRIQAGCAVENLASIRVLEKVGMTREGRGRQILPLRSGWSDNFEYSILETDPRSI